ncbi:MAG: sodium:solute symporter, partial [Pseudomonadota bacterium]
DMPLLNFALSVMIFSYSGLLGVYFTALFTSRGSAKSILYALIAGFLTPVLMQPYVVSFLFPASTFSLGFTWQLVIGVLVSFSVCMCGNAVRSDWKR